MKPGFVLLTGMMAMQASATLKLNIEGCKVQKKIEKDELQCPCTGGSGEYDWHFDSLPEGWSHENGRLFNEKGKFEDKKVFGAKVELFDKKTKQSVKKSLFFHFQNGQIAKVADDEYDFDAKKLVQNKEYENNRNNWGLWGTAQNNAVIFGLDRIKKVFEGAEAIGGGCGLGQIRPYFTKGLYREDRNPFIVNLPEDQEIDKVIESGKSEDIRQLVVNIAQGKNQCNNAAKFLERLFLKYRAKIAFYKDDVEKAKKNIKSIQQQIAFVEQQLNKAEANNANTNLKSYIVQLQQLRNQATTIDNDRQKLQVTLKEANQQIEVMQIEIAKNLQIANQIKKVDDGRKRNIAKIDEELIQLQSRIEKLNNQKSILLSESETQKTQLTEANVKIEETKVKLEAIRISISDIKNKIKELNQNYESVQLKIVATQKNIKVTGKEQNAQKLKAKLADYQAKLEQFKVALSKVQPVYNDYLNNYDDIQLIKQTKFDGCYNTFFGDNEQEFVEDDEDDSGIKFEGVDKFKKYMSEVYGKGFKNTLQINLPLARNDANKKLTQVNEAQNVWKFFPQKSKQEFTKINFKENENKLEGAEDPIKLKRTHILSPSWTKAHGSPYDDNFDEHRGRRFAEQDQECDVANLVNANAFSGKIVSINKNVAKVLNEQGESCTLYLAGCTRIETANKPLPQAGDMVYWKGKEKKDKEFDTIQMTCL